MKMDYNFLKDFCRDVKDGDVCRLTLFKQVKVNKGTKNNSSPYYIREDGVDDAMRSTLYKMKTFEFVYGKKYTDVVSDDHVFRSDDDKKKLKEYPDSECPILSRNLTTNRYCVDVVEPVSVTTSVYYYRNDTDKVYNKLDETTVNESVLQWLPKMRATDDKPIYMQFGLNSVLSVSANGKVYNNENVLGEYRLNSEELA